MTLYIARHGQTNYNELELCNADPSVDVHLTTTGITQAQKLAGDLKDHETEYFYRNDTEHGFESQARLQARQS